jgi:2-polyprenyl-3-methyl-5-hydroxy-6-metoxy-1,4-benzoquinol methylase
MPYQDRWIRGATLAHGDRECEARYALVRRVVTKFQRRITVLDLGANLGYFGCRLADEFGAVSVMVDTRPDLVAVCEANALPTTIALTKKLSVADLQELAASEHFDVVLALNVLHHFKDPAGALAAVLELGDHVLLETPSRDDAGAAHPARCAALLDLPRPPSQRCWARRRAM